MEQKTASNGGPDRRARNVGSRKRARAFPKGRQFEDARASRGARTAWLPASSSRSPHRVPASDPGSLSLSLGPASARALRGDAPAAGGGLRGRDLLFPFRRGEGGRDTAPAHDHPRLRLRSPASSRERRRCSRRSRRARTPRTVRVLTGALHGPLRHGAGLRGRPSACRLRHG